MTAGYFTRTYALWRATVGQNGYGEPVTTWSKLADIPGRAYPARMNDTFAAAQRQGIVTWTFATPASTDITEADEIRFAGRALTVQAVSVTSRGDRIEALCQEIR